MPFTVSLYGQREGPNDGRITVIDEYGERSYPLFGASFVTVDTDECTDMLLEGQDSAYRTYHLQILVKKSTSTTLHGYHIDRDAIAIVRPYLRPLDDRTI